VKKPVLGESNKGYIYRAQGAFMMTRTEDRVVKRKSFEYTVKAEEMVTVIAVKRTQAEGEKGVGGGEGGEYSRLTSAGEDLQKSAFPRRLV